MSSVLVEMGTGDASMGVPGGKPPPPPPPPGSRFTRKPPPPRARKSSRDDSSRRKSSLQESTMSSISEMSSRGSGGSEDEEGGASPSSLLISRVVLSIVATVVLWGTSLSMVNQVVYSENVLPLPALVDVYRSVIAFVNATQKEGDDYKTCVLSQLGNCNRTLQSQLNSELQRVQVRQSASHSHTPNRKHIPHTHTLPWSSLSSEL